MAQIALNRPKRSQPKAWVAQIGPDPTYRSPRRFMDGHGPSVDVFISGQ